MKRVVITGMGIVSPLGCDPDTVWNNLKKGENGILSVEECRSDIAGYGVHVAAPAREFDLKHFNLPPRKLKKISFDAKMLIHSGLNALKSAGLSFPEETSDLNVGMVLGTGNALCDEYRTTEFGDRSPKWFFDTFPNLLLSQFSIIAGITGYGCTMLNACSSSTQAIGHAFHLIQSGRTDIMIAGGVEDKLKPALISGFSRLNMTTEERDPDTACRPFDKNRNGFVMGQSGCVLVMESLDSAIKRGAEPLAEVVGYGSSLDSRSLSDADKDGKVRSMVAALNDASIGVEEIGYINAHGTSTISNDDQETLALKELFGEKIYSIPVNSSKSMLGHSFASCGAVETLICVKSLQDQKVHPTRNFRSPSDICDLDYVPGISREVSIDYCMNNTSGLGGYNSTLILKKWS